MQTKQNDVIAEQQHQVMLPDYCRWQVILIAVMMGEVLLLSVELIHGTSLDWKQLGVSSIFVVGIAVITILVLCFSRNWLNEFKGTWGWWISWLLCIVTGFVASWITAPFSVVLIEMLGQPGSDSGQLNFSLRVALVEAMVAAVMLRYFYFQQLWQQEVISQSEARVQALQSRIRPHFLFNSLNSIAALIPEDPQKAELAIEDLADLFRSALQDSGKASTLDDELAVVEKYLRIEQHRLGSRLLVKWNLGETPMDAQMPALILQPLVENAITHGVEPSAGVGAVEISSAFDGENLVLVVSSPLSKGGSFRSGNQIAVANIHERLHYHYAGCASLTMNQQDDQFRAILRFPYVKYTTG